MDISINGKGMEISDYLQDVALTRVSKLEKYFTPETKAIVMISMVRGRQVVEITIPFPGMTLRAEETSGDMYASIDAVCKKMERQILKHKTKLAKRLHEHAFDTRESVYEQAFEEETAEAGPRIVRTKRFAIKPMTAEEAALQLELIGHAFFVFTNSDTGNVNVLYRRKDGDYGLIEPEYE